MAGQAAHASAAAADALQREQQRRREEEELQRHTLQAKQRRREQRRRERRRHSQMRRQLTRHVVTRWYRSPELILLLDYSTAVDIWSAGCIFAELLQMVPDPTRPGRATAPLFPGRSCFPLSADRRDSWNDSRDQLNVILDVIGTPPPEDIEAVADPSVRAYLGGLQARPAKPLAEVCPSATADALDLLSRLLTFNPRRRLSVQQALQHPYFAPIRDLSKEILASPDLKNAITRVDDDVSSVHQLQAAIQRESRLFRREQRQIAAMTAQAQSAAAELARQQDRLYRQSRLDDDDAE